jgi:chromosome partitioning protein
VVAFFGLKGGQGRTTLVHHLAWTFSDLGVPVVAADLDPQCNLTQCFVGPEATAALATSGRTVYESLRRLIDGSAPLEGPALSHPGGSITLLAGDLALYEFATLLEDALRPSMEENAEAQRTLLALRSLFAEAAESSSAQVVLVDLAPGGTINRAALAAADYFILPLVPDPLSIMTLRFMGETLDRWRSDWQLRAELLRHSTVSWPDDGPRPLGYVVQKLLTYSARPSDSSDRSMSRIPLEFDRWIAKSLDPSPRSPVEDEHCLGVIASFGPLAPNAVEVHRPVFHLTPAEGAVGGMMRLVQRARVDYEHVARAIARRIGIRLS